MIVLTVLLTILKIIGIVLLCILGLLLLISFIPVGVTAEYSSEGFFLTALAGLIHIRILPKKEPREKTPEELQAEQRKKAEKQAAKEKKKQEKAEKKQRRKDKHQQEHQETQEEPSKLQKLGGMIPMFRELLVLVGKLQCTLRRKLKLKELTLYLTMAGGGGDPAKSAQTYGLAWAAIGNVWTVLERVFIIQKQDVQVGIDFLSTDTRIYAKATGKIFIGAVLKMGIYYGARALWIYLKHRKRMKQTNQKGGKQNVASTQ